MKVAKVNSCRANNGIVQRYLLMRTKRLSFKENCIEIGVYQWDKLVDDVDHHKEGFNKEAPQMLFKPIYLSRQFIDHLQWIMLCTCGFSTNKVWMYFRETLQRLLGTRSTAQINIDIQHLCTTAFWFFIESTFIVTFMTKFNASLLMPICHGMSTKLLFYCPKIQLGQNDLA